MVSQDNRVSIESRKINAKDLINIGLFTAIYFVVFFATGMLGFIPILMIFVPLCCPLLTGIPFMLFLTKVKKFGMITIMGIILASLMLLTGHAWPVAPLGIGLALIADLVMKQGNYKSWACIRFGYIIFSEWVIGMILPMFFMRDSFFASTREGYGATYADTLASITPPWVFYLMIGMVIIGAVMGTHLGRAMLKKHFKRAGIV